MSGLLQGITVLDFTHRLPGPLAGNLLAGLGAKVIKIEDERFQDAFASGLFAQMDESFPAWYEELNNKKEIKRFDFGSTQDQKVIHELIDQADALLMGPPMKVREKLKICHDDLLLKKRPLAVIELLASKDNKQAMHDLNALALTGLLELYVEGRNEEILPPPFLPVAGIAFGNKAAMDLLAATLKAQREKKHVFTESYLFESTQEIFSPFWPKKMREKGMKKFLHNGLYPCYCLYKTKDDAYIALAAVEEKFWHRFCEVMKLNIPADKRFFHQDQSIFNQIKEAIAKKTKAEMIKLTEHEDFCLNVI